jgi:hypothetical protein
MIVSDYMATFLLEHDHPWENAVVLKWINLAESQLDIIKTYTTKYYARVINEFQYTLPTGVDILDISSVYVNGTRYKKKDSREYKCYYSYWYEDGKLCIHPACAETDLSYVSSTSEITFASGSITTTGDDFSGVAIGDIILVSGCTVNAANNKYATVTGVAAKVLSFATGTFTAGAETAAITISVPKVKVVYENKHTTKLLANIGTDTLMLPEAYIEIYDFFLMSKIAYLDKEYVDYRNHLISFNSAVERLEKWYENRRSQNPDSDFIAKEDWGDNGTSNFDNE